MQAEKAFFIIVMQQKKITWQTSLTMGSPLFQISFVSLILKPLIVVLISRGYTGSWGFHNMTGITGLFFGL